MNDLLTEMSAEHCYLMSKSSYASLRPKILSGEIEGVETDTRMHAIAKFVSGELNTPCVALTDFHAYSDDDFDAAGASSGSDVKYINIISLTGVVTRGLTLMMRDMLMQSADNEDVIAHVIYCRTPGGAASGLNDINKAFAYIRSKGQKVYMFCDGDVKSFGVFAAAKCDGVYAFNENDEIGSIGLVFSIYSVPSGAVNAITQEKYFEIYPDLSSEKNNLSRAVDDNDEEYLRAYANEYLKEVLAELKQDRPSITEEQMHGGTYKMKDVVGTLIDGICTLPELCEKIYADWAVSANASVSGASSDDNNQASINPNSNQMKEFKNIALALGYNEPMASQVDDMLSLQPQEAEALEGKLESMTESVATLTAENTTLKEREVAITASLATMTIERDAARKEVEELRAAMAESDESKVNAVREEMQATIDSMAAEKTALEEAKAGVEAQLKTVNDEMATLKANADAAATKAATDMAEKEQIISDLQAQLAEAQSGIESKVDAGESAASNGQAAGASVMTSAPAWDPNKSPSENAAAMQAYLDEQRKKVQ